MSKINIKGTDITIVQENDEDYVSLTDMIKTHDGNFFITDWIRNRNTLDYIALWEQMHNPDFNYGEFTTITAGAGRTAFRVSIKDLKEKCNINSVISKAGRYGGTYAHVDIALHFGMWISPEFNLLLVKEFKRLKKEEASRMESGWDHRRFLAKTNYVIHTDAIKEHIIPELTEEQAKYVYANEADMLNVALFGLTAKQWKENNPDDYLNGLNMRDFADVHQLIVLSNLENNNAFLISKGIKQRERLLELRKNAIKQLNSLKKSIYSIERIQSPFKKLNSQISGKTTNGDAEFDNT